MRFISFGISVTVAAIVLLGVARTDSTPQKQALPRSFGPLTLGMTKEEVFKKIAGLTPSVCPHCALNESSAYVYVEKYPGLFPPYVYSLKKYQRGIGCAFYKGKLYRIEVSPEIKEVEAAKKKYTGLFGPPSKIEDWPNGVSWVTWENNTTVFMFSYDRVKDDSSPYTPPAGTLRHVQYIDKPLRDALEAQEKKKPTRQRH